MITKRELIIRLQNYMDKESPYSDDAESIIHWLEINNMISFKQPVQANNWSPTE